MKKQILSTVLTSAMMVSMAACSGGGTKATTAASTTAAPTTTATADAETTAGTEEETTGASSVSGSLEGVTLKFGTTALFAPFTYYDEDGTSFLGFDLDFMNALQDYLGFELDGEIQAMDYSALTTSIATGKIDMGMAALCATDTRKEVMNFTNTYYDTGQVVMVNTESSPAEITGPEALESGDYKVAVEKGTASHLYAQANFPEKCIEVHDTITTCYESLEQGKVDAILQDDANAVYYTKTVADTKLAIAGDIFNQGQSPYAIALSFDLCKKYPDIVDTFNRAIDDLTENGTFDQIYDKWLK